MKYPNTFRELLTLSRKECYNFDKYTPTDWKYIAKYLVYHYGLRNTYIILDSKHMRWADDMSGGNVTFQTWLRYWDTVSEDIQGLITNYLKEYPDDQPNTK